MRVSLEHLLQNATLAGLLMVCCSVCPGQSNDLTQVVMVHPEEIADPIPNPYMGLGLWAGPRYYGADPQRYYTVEDLTTGFGDDAPLFNWVMVDWDWAVLEPREGEFNWQDFDTVAHYWSKRGKQLVVRLWDTDDAGWAGKPGLPVVPQWLWDKGVKSHQYVGNGGKKMLEPDYKDPSFHSVYLPELNLSGLLQNVMTNPTRRSSSYRSRGTGIGWIGQPGIRRFNFPA